MFYVQLYTFQYPIQLNLSAINGSRRLAVNSLIVNPNGAMLGFTIPPFTTNLRVAKGLLSAAVLNWTATRLTSRTA